VSTSSKRNTSISTATETREPMGARPPTEPGAEARRSAARPTPGPRASRGASAIPAPRKAELHRVSLSSRPLPTHEQIARRAYEIWVQSGHVMGRDAENWAQAERELSAGCTSPESSAHQA
jgi:hypothetical protein